MAKKRDEKTANEKRAATYRAQVPYRELKAILAHYGSDRDAAKAVGVSAGSLSRWLNGKSGMNSKNREVILVHYRGLTRAPAEPKVAPLSLPERLKAALTPAESNPDVLATLARIEAKLDLLIVSWEIDLPA